MGCVRGRSCGAPSSFVAGETVAVDYNGLSSPALMAGVGMVAVFGAAANATITCTVMGVELLGWQPLLPVALGCVAARLWSSHRHIYEVVRRSVVDLP